MKELWKKHKPFLAENLSDFRAEITKFFCAFNVNQVLLAENESSYMF